MKPLRMQRKDRKPLILDAALQAAEVFGFSDFTRDNVAEIAGVSPALINSYFKNKKQLKKRVMVMAIKKESLQVIANGLTTGDITARKCDPDLQIKSLSSMVTA